MEFFICGFTQPKKLRMLCRVSFTAQCVRNGNVLGTIHFKGNVIEDLCHHVDSHALAGAKMSSLLHGEDSSSLSPSRSSPTPSSTPSNSPSRPKSVPGLPSTPQYCTDDNDDHWDSPHHTSPYIPPQAMLWLTLALPTLPRSVPPSMTLTSRTTTGRKEPGCWLHLTRVVMWRLTTQVTCYISLQLDLVTVEDMVVKNVLK